MSDISRESQFRKTRKIIEEMKRARSTTGQGEDIMVFLRMAEAFLDDYENCHTGHEADKK